MQFNVPVGQTLDICVDIEIAQDIIFEETEMFFVNLTADNGLLCPTDTTGSVSIIDSTRENTIDTIDCTYTG
jgi:predicted AAA+ superfamily ATPase